MVKAWKHELDIARYTRHIKLNHGNFQAYNNRGNVYQQLGKQELAIADYNKAIELNPEYFIAYNNRGNLYQQLGKYELAITDCNKAIELRQKNGMPYNNRGFAYLMAGRLEEAEKDIRKSLELNANNIYALNSMSELYAIKNDPVETCRWLMLAIKRGYNKWNYLRTSKTYDNIRKHPCFKEILSRRPDCSTSRRPSGRFVK